VTTKTKRRADAYIELRAEVIQRDRAEVARCWEAYEAAQALSRQTQLDHLRAIERQQANLRTIRAAEGIEEGP